MNLPKRNRKKRRQLHLESLEQRRLLAVDGVIIDLSGSGGIDLFDPNVGGAIQSGFTTNGLGMTIGTMNVPGVNNQPPVAGNDDVQVAEDTGSTDITTQVLSNDSDPDPNDTLTITAKGGTTTGQASLSSGVLTYDPNGQFESLQPGESASDSFTYTVSDGHNGNTTATVTVTITGVNDAPSFTAGADQTINEDAGAQSVSGWASALHDGDTGSGQSLMFNVTGNSNASLFSVAPAIDASGNLTYTPAGNANGSATITINLQDDGGTANGGADTSVDQSFTINVTPVNDAPSFALATTAETIDENEGPQTHTEFATAISAGPSDESGQGLTFVVTSNSNPAPFSSGPAVDSEGTLTFTTADEADGTATITFALMDTGGMANGGSDTSSEQTLTLTVNEVNEAPSIVSAGGLNFTRNLSGQSTPAAATPTLAGITLGGAGVELWPAFDANITRYSVYPGSNTTEVTLTLDSLNANDVLRLDGQLITDGQEVTLPELGLGESVSIVVTDASGESNEYELVSVPADFPRFEVLALTEDVSEGALYFAIGRFLIIADNYGVPYWTKLEATRVSDFKRHEDGQYSYNVRPPGELTSWGRTIVEYVVLDDNLAEVGRYRTEGLEHTDGHDFLLLPNGNHVVMAYEGMSHDLSDYGLAADEFVWDSMLQEVTPGGEVVFQWSSFPEVPVSDALRWLNQDYAHLNSIDVDDNGDYLLSLRGTSQVVKVDGTSGEVVWKLGGLSNDFTILDDPLSYFCGQHTAGWLPNGNLLLFDNGLTDPANCTPGGPARTYSRAVEYEIDEVNMVASLVWSFADDTYTRSRGSTQRHPNGNTLIGWGSNPDKLASEVDSEGNKVFEIRAYEGDSNLTTYRVLRYPEPNIADPVNVFTIDEEQTLSWSATVADIDQPANDVTFSLVGSPAGASITANGEFTWTPSEAQGPARYTFDVVATDNGTPPLSTRETITISVEEVGTPPVVPTPNFAATGNVPILVGAEDGLLNGATDADLPANELSVSEINTAATWGSVTFDSDGSFTYVSAPGFQGTDTFEFTVTDGFEFVTQTANVVVSDTIWFVDNSAAPGGDGTLQAPFNAFTPLNEDGSDLDDPGDVIYVAAGAGVYNVTHGDPNVHDHGFELEDDQVVIGEGAQGATLLGWLSTNTEVEIAAFSATLPPIGGTNPHVTNTSGDVFTAASGNLITGVTLDPVASAGIAGDGVEDLVVEFVIIITSGGTNNNEGINLRTVTGTLTFRNIDIGSEDGGTNNGPAIQIDGGTAELMFNDVDIDQSGGTLLNIINTFSSTLTFDDNSELKLSNSNQSALTIAGNDGGTVILNSDGLEVDTSATVVFNIVDNRGLAATTPVNDAPLFQVPDQAPEAFEDGGPQVVNGFARDISPGADATEADQTLAFTVLADPGLFAVPPEIDSAGNLTYTPADNAFGTVQVSVQLRDDGGTQDGGVDRSDVHSFSIVIKPVNDRPKFMLGPNPAAIPEDAAPQTIDGFAHDLHAGPPNEAGQLLIFDIIGNTNPALFATGPTISPSGNLTYTPAPNANGTATVTVGLRDNGGTDHGGIDLSLLQTFDITIAPAVNDPPMFDMPTSFGADLHAGSQTVNGFVSNIQPGPPDEASQSVSLAITGNDNPGIFATQPAIDNNGTLTFAPSAIGSATITLQATDNGGTDFGGNDTSAPRTFTLTVSEGNVAPVLGAVGDRTVNETQTLAFTATATDVNGNTLHFSLANEPAGATITDGGVFSWTPSEAQGPDTFTFDVLVTDGEFTDKETIEVTVHEINSPPVLDVIGNKTATAGQLLAFAAAASDSDEPTNGWTFSLSGNAPTGTLMTPAGAFTWTPAAAQANQEFTFDVIVTDKGSPAMSDSESITVTVNDVVLPTIADVKLEIAQGNVGGETKYFSYFYLDAVGAGSSNASRIDLRRVNDSAFSRPDFEFDDQQVGYQYDSLSDFLAAHNGVHQFGIDLDGDGDQESTFSVDVDLDGFTAASFPDYANITAPIGTINSTTPTITWDAISGAESLYISTVKNNQDLDEVWFTHPELPGSATSVTAGTQPTGEPLFASVQANFRRDDLASSNSDDGAVNLSFYTNSIATTSFEIPATDFATIELELGQFTEPGESPFYMFLLDVEVDDSRTNNQTKLLFEAPDEPGFNELSGGPTSGYEDIEQEPGETAAEFFALFSGDWKFRVDFAGDGFDAAQGDEQITLDVDLTNVATAFPVAPQLTGPAAAGTVSTESGTPSLSWNPLNQNDIDFIIVNVTEVGGDELVDEDLANSATAVNLTGATPGTTLDVNVGAIDIDNSWATISNDSPAVDFEFWLGGYTAPQIDVASADVADIYVEVIEANIGGELVYFASMQVEISASQFSLPMQVLLKGPNDTSFREMRTAPDPDGLPEGRWVRADIEPDGDGSLNTLLNWVDGTYVVQVNFGNDTTIDLDLEFDLGTSGLSANDFADAPTNVSPGTGQTLPINQREVTITWEEDPTADFISVQLLAGDTDGPMMFESVIPIGTKQVTTNLMPSGIGLAMPVIANKVHDIVMTTDPIDVAFVMGATALWDFDIAEQLKSITPTNASGFYGGGPDVLGGVGFEFDGLAGPAEVMFEYQPTRHTDQWWYVAGGDTPGQRLHGDFLPTGDGTLQAWLIEVEDTNDDPVGFTHVDLTLHYDPAQFDAPSNGINIEQHLGDFQYDSAAGEWVELTLLAQHFENDTVTVRATDAGSYIVLGYDPSAANSAPYFPADWIGYSQMEILQINGASDDPFYIGNVDISGIGSNVQQGSRLLIKGPGESTFTLYDDGGNDYAYAFLEEQFSSLSDLVAARQGTYEVQIDYENDGAPDDSFSLTFDLSGLTESSLPDMPTITSPTSTTVVAAGQATTVAWDLQPDVDSMFSFVHITNGPGLDDNEGIREIDFSESTAHVEIDGLPTSEELMLGVGANETHHHRATGNSTAGTVHTELELTTVNTVFFGGSALRASNGQGTGAASLAIEQLAPIVEEAIQRLESVGKFCTLTSVDFEIADLPDGILGSSTTSTVLIDLDAAGHGWFIDLTPGDDNEFLPGAMLTKPSDSPDDPSGQVDLLTVVMHELGHSLGLGHREAISDLMSESLPTGTRRLPAADFSDDLLDLLAADVAQSPFSAI